MAENTTDDTLTLATELTIAWLGNPHTRAAGEDVPAFLQTVHAAVAKLAAPAPATAKQEAPAPADHAPAVTVRKSLASKDHIVSLIDGKPYKTLKRHLGTHGLTPDEYRQRYGLKPDYPMVAESYGAMRREMAKKIGLGRKTVEKAPAKKPAKARRAKPAVAQPAE